MPGNEYIAGASESGKLLSLPLPSTMWIAGLFSCASPLGLSVTSIISILLRPVKSSCLTLAVIPSSRSTNLAFPATSAITGLVKGSHWARISPGFTLLPVAKFKTVPYGTL